jgi:uncharacterized protein YhfF
MHQKEIKLAFKVVNGMRTIEFGLPGESRDRILKFLLEGNKRATAGLMSEYETENEPIEHVGEKLGILNNEDELVAIVQVTKIGIHRFNDVPDEFALAEAEGDLSAEDFRKSHSDFWIRSGEDLNDDTQVVCVYFDLIEVL